MASLTQITKRRRQLVAKNLGKKNRKARAKAGTPKFPVHPPQAQSATK